MIINRALYFKARWVAHGPCYFLRRQVEAVNKKEDSDQFIYEEGCRAKWAFRCEVEGCTANVFPDLDGLRQHMSFHFLYIIVLLVLKWWLIPLLSLYYRPTCICTYCYHVTRSPYIHNHIRSYHKQENHKPFKISPELQSAVAKYYENGDSELLFRTVHEQTPRSRYALVDIVNGRMQFAWMTRLLLLPHLADFILWSCKDNYLILEI